MGVQGIFERFLNTRNIPTKQYIITLMPFTILTDYIRWYFVFVPRYFLSLLFRYINYIDNKLAITVMIEYFFVPLFGDTTILGFVLGFVFRLIRITFGIVVLFVFLINYFIVLIFWVIAPAIFLYHGAMYFLVFLLLSFSFFLIKRLYFPTQHTHNVSKITDLKHTFTTASKRIYSTLREGVSSKEKFITLLLKSCEVEQMILRLELKYADIEHILISNLDFNEATLFQSIFKYKDFDHFVRPNLLFLAIVEGSKKVQLELTKKNVTLIDIEETYRWQVQDRTLNYRSHIWDLDYKTYRTGGLNRAWIARPTPLLNKVSEDITKLAQEQNNFAVFGKEKIIESIKEALAKVGRKNVLIIGKPGVGKSSVVYGLAEEIVNGKSNSLTRFKRIVRLDATKLLALNDKKSEELINIINEIESEKNTILFIDDIHILSSMSSANLNKQGLLEYLQPYLKEGKLQVIGTSSYKNFKEFIEPNVSFSRLFEQFEIEEPTDEEVLNILEYNILNSDKLYSIQALKGIVELSKKYIRDRVLPDKAIQTIEILSSKDTDNIIYLDEVKEYITKVTGIPVNDVSIEETKNLLNLENDLNSLVIAQPRATKLISNTIIRSRTGARSGKKPIASFLFAGPTGVGKTYTAKMLAKYLFGQEEMLTRFDMSEFQNLEDTKVFINRLCDVVSDKAYAVVLIDEIEKANQKLILTLLQVLDEARLTNSDGEICDFTQTIIIATTNIGNRVIDHLYNAGKTDPEIEAQAMVKIKNHFAPEFLNRFTDIVVFSSLSKVEILNVVKLEVIKLVEIFKKDKHIELTYSDAFIYFIANSSYSSEYGARPVYRFLEEEIETKIAKLILQGELSTGSTYNLDQLITTKGASQNNLSSYFGLRPPVPH